jgi:hypothetical protein
MVKETINDYKPPVAKYTTPSVAVRKYQNWQPISLSFYIYKRTLVDPTRISPHFQIQNPFHLISPPLPSLSQNGIRNFKRHRIYKTT